jgi:hypothetical protein
MCTGDHVTVLNGVIVDSGGRGTPSATRALLKPALFNDQCGIVSNKSDELELRNSSITGDFSISRLADYLALCNMSISGNLNLTNIPSATTLDVGATTHGYLCSANTIGGSVIVDNSRLTYLSNTTISGNLTCQNGGTVYCMYNTTVKGSNSCPPPSSTNCP